MPTDSLMITDTALLTMPVDRVPWTATPKITGSLLSIGDDSQGNPILFLLGGDVKWTVGVELSFDPPLPGGYSVGLYADGGGEPAPGLHNFLGGTTFNEGATIARFIVEIDGAQTDAFFMVIYGGTGFPPHGKCAVRSLSILPAGTLPRARYTGSTPQPVVTNTDTLVAFENEATFHPFISQAEQDDGHRFTFLSSGVWAVTATTRFVGGGGAGERYAALVSDNHGQREVITAGGGYNGSAPETTNLSYTDYFPEGSYVEVSTWQNGENSLNLEGAEIWKNITFALLVPDPV